jgi:hypothetical protein
LAASTFKLVSRGEGGASYGTIESATAITASTTTNKWQIEAFSQARIYASITYNSGTSGTLDIYLQSLLGDDSTWHDIAHFTQFTTASANRVISLVSGGNKEEAKNDAALAAATVNSVWFGRWWRLKYVVGGTNPNYTASIYIEAQ